jgi:hypothetical protein
VGGKKVFRGRSITFCRTEKSFQRPVLNFLSHREKISERCPQLSVAQRKVFRDLSLTFYRREKRFQRPVLNFLSQREKFSETCPQLSVAERKGFEKPFQTSYQRGFLTITGGSSGTPSLPFCRHREFLLRRRAWMCDGDWFLVH